MKPGAALAALRRTTWHQCHVCGKRFSGIKTAKFCSNACRQAAKYKRAKRDGH
jgi:ribosomal protein L34E